MRPVTIPGKSKGGPHFNPEDLPLLEEGLRLVPDLLLTLVFAKLAKGRLSYPVESHDRLLPLFDGDKTFVFEGTALDFATVQMFFPQDFFPIRSEHEFLTKVYMSFIVGRESHARTRKYVNFQGLVEDLKIAPEVAKTLPIPQ